MTLPEDQARPAEQGQQDGKAAFPCAYCGADTHEDLVKAAFWGPRGLVAIEDIPARVCEGCGEQFYDDKTTQRIEGIVNGSTAVPQRQATVPVFSLADAGNAARRTS
ncbi:MAG: YgiT-type zinc finger protein [Planctomycetes bacterium]|nr:YgiT-type zinc finger protein [Planctomycetota bacterium]